MEELDLLKKDWNKDGGRFPKVSEKEIYAMLHKKSSSIIKWILLISILEFSFFLLLTLLLSDHPNAKKMELSMPGYLNIAMYVIDMGINLFFLYLFYVNYRKIRNTDNIKNLMANILKTRKTVSTYIYVKISYLVVFSIISLIILFNNDPEWLMLLHNAEEKGNGVMAYAAYIVFGLLLIALFALAFWLFYKLIYGVLLKRLYRNYEELKKIDL